MYKLINMMMISNVRQTFYLSYLPTFLNTEYHIFNNIPFPDTLFTTDEHFVRFLPF